MNFLVIIAAVLACAAAKPQAVTYAGLPYATPYHGFSAYHHGLGLHGLPYAAAPALTYAAAPLAAPALTYAAAPAVVAPAFTKTQYHAQDELGQASHGYAYPGQAHAVVRDAAGNERGSYAYVNPEGNEIRVDYTAGHGGFQVASNALPVGPPGPIPDTPEVAHARAAHFAAHAEAKARSHLRKKRGVVAPLAAPLHYSALAAPALTYAAAAPALHYSAVHAPALHHYGHHYAAPALTYAAAPAVHAAIAAPALTYAAAPAVHAAPALTYAAAAPAVVAAPTHALRVAELTKIVNNPGHAVSYRVD